VKRITDFRSMSWRRTSILREVFLVCLEQLGFENFELYIVDAKA